MSDDEKREQDEAPEVEGHKMNRGLNEDDRDDEETPDVEGHFKNRYSPVNKKNVAKPS